MPLTAAPATPFVGRLDEIARLGACLDAAAGGTPQLALVTGEPGIGKTRLAAEAARDGARRGFAVAWGRCWEDDGAPAFWPWIQALRALARPDVPLPHDLVTLLPELAPEASPAPAGPTRSPLLPSPLESERSRFRLFDACSRYLGGLATHTPLLLVLDDIHAADEPSLLLLQFLSRAANGTRLVVIATHRDAEVRADAHRAERFATLARRAERVELRGWQRNEVGLFLAGALGAPPDDGLVAAVTAATAGNPLFVDGFAHELRRQPGDRRRALPAVLPDGIRATLRQRLQPLDDDCRALLAAAAVGGQRFAARTLAHVGDCPLPAVLDRIEAARHADLVAAVDPTTGTFAFAHPLIRETLYTDLPPAQRMNLHRRWAAALRALHAAQLDDHAAEIARHHFSAGLEDDLAAAIDLAERAAVRAQARCAYEDAARLREQALVALAAGGGSERRRCELQVGLAEAYLCAGQTLRAREVAAEAARVARRLGAPALHARAALLFGGVVIGVGIPDPELLQLLEDSLDLLGDGESELRAIVSARLAVRLHLPTDGPRRILLSEQALQLAREAASDEAMAYALDARHMAQWESTDLAGQLAVADDLILAARGCGNRELVLHGIHLQIADHLEAGDIGAADREIARYETLAADLHQAHYAFRARALRAMRAMLNGEFDRSERLAAEAVDFANQAQTPLGIAFQAAHALAFDRTRGRLTSAETIARPLVEALPTIAGIRLGLAALYADLGRSDEAAAYFASSAAADFADVPRDNNWLLTTSLAAEIAAHLGDTRAAALLFDRLAPFADRHAVAASGWTSLGSIARPLGLLAATLGRNDDAVVLLERALAAHQQMRAHAFVVHTRLDLAEILVRSPGGGDARARIAELATAALDHARAFGMDRHVTRASALLDAAPVAAAPADEAAACRREGDYWSIDFAGHACRLRDIRGLHYLARLLARPGDEVHCLDLAGAGVARPTESGAAALLDERARREYRTRLGELRAELDDAEACRDTGRAERARAELDALETQLARAFGLGGRARSSGSAAERARVAVTKSLRLAVDRVAAHHPALAAHLQATLRTGTWCAYVPDPRHPIRWRLD